MLKKFLPMCVFLLTVFFSFPALSSAEKAVVIDAGHGGKFTGTCGFTREPGKDLCERDVNLNVALKLQTALKGSGIKVYMTRTADVDFSSGSQADDLEARMKVANSYITGNNDNTIFISVHHNANPTSPYVRGYETYYYDGVHEFQPDYPHDPLQIKYLLDNKRLAEDIHPIVVKDLGLIDRKIRNDQSFYVIRNAQAPAVLVELGYMTNQQEEARIKTADYQNKAAQALAKGIVQYFKVFEVYKDSTKLATFNTKQEAINYASSQTSFVQVFDKYQQTFVWDNGNFQVYQKTGGLVKSFLTPDDALTFANGQAETRIVAKDTGYTVWSNYLNKNYVVLDNTDKELQRYFDFDEAVAFASKTANTKVINRVTSDVVWTNIDGLAVTRSINSETISGVDRYQTAIEVSKKLYPTGFPDEKTEKVVLLATGQNPADALSAAPLSPKFGKAPLLLTKSIDSLLPEVKNEIVRLKADKVIIVGGPGVISSSIEKELNDLGIQTERLYGQNRYETNAQILAKLGTVQGAFVASGISYPDALAAAPIAAANNWAIVLTNQNSLTSAALSYVKDKNVVVLGGTGVVSEQISSAIQAQNSAQSVTRTGGADRYETLAALLWHFKDSIHSDTINVTTGTNFPDAMAAAPLSIDNKAPLILVHNDVNKSVESFLMKYAEETKVTNVNAIGGLVTESVKLSIMNKIK